MAVAAGVLVLTSGCVSRAGGPTAAGTTTTTTSSPPMTEDPALADEAAEILARGHGSWKDAMCEPPSFTPDPHAPVDADFTSTRSAGIDTYVLPMDGEAVVARLTVEPGLDLMLAIMLEFGGSDWCAYAFTWCPAGFPGLPPFMVGHSDVTTMDELDREVLCEG